MKLLAFLALYRPVWSLLLSPMMKKPKTSCEVDFTRVGRVEKCFVKGEETCPVSAMRRNQTYMVYPGGKTRCMASVDPAFAFQVLRGDPDKLVIEFQGGGACWNRLSYMANTCEVQTAFPIGREGIFDGRPEHNPFANFTIVSIMYCAGDLHAGNVTHSWTDGFLQPVKQFGYHNARSALDWAKANLQGRLSNLVAIGQSAGGIGAQVWATTLLSEFDYAHASIISDSYVGVFPSGFQGPIFKDLGVCGLSIIGDMKERCESGEITIPDVFENAMMKFPQVTFASIHGTRESVQLDFYKKTAISVGRFLDAATASPKTFGESVSKILSRFHRYSNYVSLQIPHSWHSYSSCDAVYRLQFMWKGGLYTTADWLRQFSGEPPTGGYYSISA